MVSRPGLLSDRGELEALFDELAAELRRLGVAGEVVMVGGAWLLWHAQRVATRDVDSARRLDPQLADAIDAVGQRHDLRSGWLNDAAAAFWPAGASLEDSAVVYEREALVVRAPAPELVFVMKLYRAEPQDRDDMVLCCGRCAASPVPRTPWRRSRPRIPMPLRTSTSSTTSARLRATPLAPDQTYGLGCDRWKPVRARIGNAGAASERSRLVPGDG